MGFLVWLLYFFHFLCFYYSSTLLVSLLLSTWLDWGEEIATDGLLNNFSVLLGLISFTE